MQVNLFDLGARKQIIEEINGDENKQRKAESLKRFEIYRDRQHNYLIKKLQENFNINTVKEMRKISSINLTKRIVDEQASIYKNPPQRNWVNASENEILQLENIYKFANANTKFKKANCYFKLFDQCAIQVLPRKNIIQFNVLAPHMYDVIPDEEDPEQPFAYILSAFDKAEFLTNNVSNIELKSIPRNPLFSFVSDDFRNQKIADPNDYKSNLMKYVVWTDEFHFVMNGKGELEGDILQNPIGELPFVDVAFEKDMEFFVRKGNNVVDFNLDFAVLLSDTATINALQGYSQAVVYAVKQPESMIVGPNHILFMQLNPEQPEIQPKFEFQTPSPDMASSIELLETTLRLFLTSRGLDPKIVSGKLEGKSFSSGIERLLSMIEKFEASQADFDLFKWVEKEVFRKAVKWSNIMQGVNDEKALIDELNLATISDKVSMEIIFARPENIQTQSDKEDSVIKKMESGLMSKAEAIAELRGIPLEEAKKVLEMIESESMMGVVVGQAQANA